MEEGDPDTMNRPPRPPEEPVVNKSMGLRIAIQTGAIAGVTLSAYAIGLWLYPDELIRAGTMAFVTISFSELLRAFTARSERYQIFSIGLFSSRWMVLAVSSSLLLLLATVYVPFLQPVFDTVALGLTEWSIILPLIIIPALVAEITKYVLGLRERFALAG